jgi:hypothetical protein
MIWLWWAVAGFALAALAWHEVADHHVLARVFRRQVRASDHHAMWDGIGRPQRIAVRAEMVLFAALAAAVAGIFPVPAAVAAGVLTLICAPWVLFGRHA